MAYDPKSADAGDADLALLVPTAEEIAALEALFERIVTDRVATRAVLSLVAIDPLVGEWLAAHSPAAFRAANSLLAEAA
jgi:hypothetical protein